MKIIKVLLLCALMLFALPAWAMTPAQLATFKAAILADANLEQMRADNDYNGIAAYYNEPAAPEFWVWRSRVTRSEIYHSTSHTTSTWNWATYKAQSVVEQNSWTQMFMGDEGNFALLNFRTGVATIFTGSAAQTTQRDHCLAIGKKRASRVERLFAVTDPGVIPGAGNGAAATPANATFEGAVNFSDVGAALAI